MLVMIYEIHLIANFFMSRPGLLIASATADASLREAETEHLRGVSF